MPTYIPNKIFLFPIAAITALIIGLFLFAKFGPSIPLSIITTTKTDLFTVTAEGKASAAPDIAQINLGVTINAPTVSGAQTQANSTINSIGSAIKKLGVGDKDIQTVSYNLRPDYDYSVSGSQRIKGYVIDVSLLVKARQFDKINQIIDAAMASGGNMVGGLNFTLDDETQSKVESQARTQAITKAKQKAAEIAKESGLTLGKIINVSENTSNSFRPVPMMAKAADSGQSAPTQIEPGTSEISLSVSLSYETR